ncbi:MAG: HpcH/HpaI aldolase/citrate lyase family protein [Candidatus Cloacimonetes bacterium]|nr:HpcH/HpaI aldolase/citrate lyase family protein [Candidatus Cloacimonadota bacterium]
MSKITTVGNTGKDVRSDCQVTLELTDSGAIEIILKSKVAKLFGESIEQQCREMLAFFEVKSACMAIEDAGALPFVIAARIEAAICQSTGSNKQYLPPMLPENEYATSRERLRRSRLYLPGNTPKLMLNAGIHMSDGIILDLEDSVAPARKDEARMLVRNALRQVNFYGSERMVRINQLPRGLGDLEYIVPHNVNLVLVPKVETAAQIIAVDEKIAALLPDGAPPVWLMPIIESALGVINAYDIATASSNVVAIAIGLEDYTADLGAERTAAGRESFHARNVLVNAARAAGIQAIDSVFSDVGDMDALARVVDESRSLGFDGMGCIHPRQIAVIHKHYAPTEKQLEKAKRIVLAFHEAEARGLGVVSLGSKMIDPPVVKRAQKMIELAVAAGILAADWRE